MVHEPRRYSQLASVPKADFFGVLGQGMDAVASHVETLVGAGKRSGNAGDSLAAEILLVIAREEAGKFLVLLDAARIPQRAQARMAKQLKRAGDHLAKSLYFEMADLRPATLSEVEHCLDEARRSHYLDGPNYADWTFRNRALADREDLMYVDYQETDEGFIWHQPYVSQSESPHVSQVFQLVADMRAAGFCDPTGLKVINRIWRDIVPTNGSDGSQDTHWEDIASRNACTLDQILAVGVAEEIGAGARRRIVNTWTFPMHSLKLTRINVTRSSIDKEQRRRMRAALWDESDYSDIAAEQWEDGPADIARDMLGDFSGDEVDHQAEMSRARAEGIAEERLRFINEE